MKYRITANLFFNHLDDASEALDKLSEAFETAQVINLGTDTEETSFYQMEECYHDEAFSRPCVLLQREEKSTC